ncbi:hypothetical protein DFJ43DRAFT_1037754 [Lentinula guzmanii]|uniref:WD40 repeat-like protein n=1 Tax=Lentinula guzmanii TaxID=2804957 RepID=A0AA38JKZ9_9AGAR|nr:hypothetical protein DFJ43DRAFT_1044677 [Lentinula guzmanii]KAJ3734554.1 hypothetical protein DFJ43DRAFT_1037754 [Lentinula guzmanii]
MASGESITSEVRMCESPMHRDLGKSISILGKAYYFGARTTHMTWVIQDDILEEFAQFMKLSRATSAKSPDSKSVVAANLCQGLDWFKIMPDKLKKMSSTYQPQQINIPLPVLFIDNGQAVIMGSTNGCALILEVKHGEKMQALKHGSDQTWVTSLAYIEPIGRSRMIATGDGNRGQRTRIILWIENNSKKSSSKFSRSWIVILKIIDFVFVIGHISIILIGIISAILWVWTPQWREANLGTALGIYFTKPTLPATPAPSLRPDITSSHLMTKTRKLLEILEDLLVVVVHQWYSHDGCQR